MSEVVDAGYSILQLSLLKLKTETESTDDGLRNNETSFLFPFEVPARVEELRTSVTLEGA